MLNTARVLQPLRRDGPERQRSTPSFADLLAVLRHQRRIVLAVLVLFLAAAGFYVATAPRLYTATASLLIDPRQEDPLQKQRPASDAQIETTTLESQAQILTSDTIARAVVRQLDLTHDPEFMRDDTPLVLRWIRQALALLTEEMARPPTPADVEQDAVDRLTHMISAGRSGRSYILTLSIVARDPEKAARIANAVASAYSDDQLSFRLASVDRSAGWLKTRAAELRQQSLDADRAVQAYKSANGIVDTPRGVVQEQQLNDLNTQLALARAQVAEKRGRLERASTLGEDDMPDPSFAESIANPVIVKLRQQYLDDQRRETELRTRYGESHPAVVTLRANMDELRRSVRDEMARIIESFRSDYRTAKASQDELERNVARLMEQAGQTNRERVELRALETTAQTYRTLFETFLQQYATTLQQQSFPILTTRVITQAQAPKRKSHPRTSLILLGSAVAGLGFGWLIGLARETAFPVLRTEREIEDLTGLTPLGQIPNIAHKRRPFWRNARRTRSPDANRFVGGGSALLQITRMYPHSWFADTIAHVHRALAAAEGRRGARIVGILSAQPGEGKTIVAANLAQHLAKAGARTLLLDLDLHHPTLTETTQAAGEQGLGEAVASEAGMRAALVIDGESGLCFIPSGGARRAHHSAEALTSPLLQTFVERMRESFDYVVLDLPTLDSVIDARAVSMLADSFVVVGAADRTQADALLRALDRWETAGLMPIVGFVLNRVKSRDPRRLRRAADARAENPLPVKPTRAGLRSVG